MDAGIRAFDGLERHDGHVLDYGRLADIEAADLLGHAEAELHVLAFLSRRLALRDDAAVRHQAAYERRLVKGLDAGLGEFPHEHHHDRVVLAVRQLHDELQHASVRLHLAREQQLLRDLADHRDLADLVFLEIVQHGIEMRDADGLAVRRAFLELCVRLRQQSDGIDLITEELCRLRTLNWQFAGAGQQSDSFHNDSPEIPTPSSQS